MPKLVIRRAASRCTRSGLGERLQERHQDRPLAQQVHLVERGPLHLQHDVGLPVERRSRRARCARPPARRRRRQWNAPSPAPVSTSTSSPLFARRPPRPASARRGARRAPFPRHRDLHGARSWVARAIPTARVLQKGIRVRLRPSAIVGCGVGLRIPTSVRDGDTRLPVRIRRGTRLWPRPQRRGARPPSSAIAVSYRPGRRSGCRGGPVPSARDAVCCRCR